MDQILPTVLRFERFEIDFTRGCVRVGGRDVALRPKAFDVLRYLAENRGRLVSKQELLDAVWGRIAVSDDSLVQCIRELRQNLGDGDHQLIKTVARRGYMLDARTLAAQEQPRRAVATTPLLPAGRRTRLRWVAAAAATIAVLALLVFPPTEALRPLASLLSDADMSRVSELAATKELPVPEFRIFPLAEDVPDDLRRFVGVWVSDTGWVYSGRQFMLIVTGVDREGLVSGFLVNGPAKPYSRVRGPAFSGPFQGRIDHGTLRYDGYAGMSLASLNDDGQMLFKLAFQTGGTSAVVLDPVWTLPARDRFRSAKAALPR